MGQSMGQTGSQSLPVKRFINDPKEVVHDAIDGFLWTNPDVHLLDEFPEVKVLVRADWQRDRVAVVAGGGSGHEPADIGFIGQGMLTAVVCGEIFASPSAYAVARALEAVTGPAGAIVVIRSHSGIRLNFLAAVKEVSSNLQLKVKVVIVSDDLSTSMCNGEGTSFAGARGVAGSLLVVKVAGAAAEAGQPLEAVFAEAESAAQVVRTQGVCFESCSIPGQVSRKQRIPPDEMEVGLGIHGEPGRLRLKVTATAKEVIETVMSQLSAHVSPDEPLCAMLNNLGTVPQMEMHIVAAQVMRSELGSRIKLFIGPGQLMTALDTNGISVTVMPLTKEREMRLRAPVGCRRWIPPVVPVEPTFSAHTSNLSPNSTSQYSKAVSSRFPPSEHAAVARLLSRACEAIINAEPELNELDAHVADGDCGRNMAHAAELLQSAIQARTLPLAEPGPLCLRLADIFRGVDGMLAALFSVFFAAAGRCLVPQRMRRSHSMPEALKGCRTGSKEIQAQSAPELKKMNTARAQPILSHEDSGISNCGAAVDDDDGGWHNFSVLQDALEQAEKEVKNVGESSEGCRTFLDALVPAARSAKRQLMGLVEHRGCIREDVACARPLEDETRSFSWEEVALAAQEGARATAAMTTAVGRAAHTAPAKREGVPDTGAVLLALALTAMAGPREGMLQAIPNDKAILQHLRIGEAIGQGAFGAVYAATRVGSGEEVAVKVTKQGKESGPRSFGGLDCLDKQCASNWLFTRKPHITRVYDVLVSPTSVYLVMERLDGPDLHDWLTQPEGEQRSEKRVAHLVKQMLLVAREVHLKGFVHRDFKFENFRFTDNSAQELKLVDIVGTMCFRPDRLTEKSWCGTGPYLSPEALLGEVSPSVDMWAIGVMAYVLLSGSFPFIAASLAELFEAHKQAPSFNSRGWQAISPEGVTLVQRLLNSDVVLRPDASEALALMDDEETGWLSQCAKRPRASQPLPLLNGTACSGPLGDVDVANILAPLEVAEPAAMKTLFLVRHGEALHNVEEKKVQKRAEREAIATGLTKGSPEFAAYVEGARNQVLKDEAFRDAPLSPAGKAQALDALAEINQLLSRGLPEPTGILVSPLQRTLQTAAMIFPKHPNVHVREELRERRTGLPCDERTHADDVYNRDTFCFMSFDKLRCLDRKKNRSKSTMPVLDDSAPDGGIGSKFGIISNNDSIVEMVLELEGKNQLRDRTAQIAELLRDLGGDSLAVVTHKAFLRELERGPLGRPAATEFGNCEVRVYDVTLPTEGGILAKLRYSREEGLRTYSKAGSTRFPEHDHQE